MTTSLWSAKSEPALRNDDPTLFTIANTCKVVCLWHQNVVIQYRMATQPRRLTLPYVLMILTSTHEPWLNERGATKLRTGIHFAEVHLGLFLYKKMTRSAEKSLCSEVEVRNCGTALPCFLIISPRFCYEGYVIVTQCYVSVHNVTNCFIHSRHVDSIISFIIRQRQASHRRLPSLSNTIMMTKQC